jgi:aspartyl-tRNA(Asn)/glutamyl-tRNA(Gln) amidotransferase subunit A
VIDWAALEAQNAKLNAFVEFDRAARGREGPFAGVTVGVKANIAVKGLVWTAGMEAFRHRIAERDAAVVAALRGAGATIIGSLNMEEAALGAKTDNIWFGPTQNPHRLGYTPGGSSGGSGAAVAAGFCDAALGSDTMGSVRIPASYCGVYGFKPANGAVSQDGLEVAEASLDVIGPLARSLDTLEAVARVMSDFGEGGAEQVVTISELGGVVCSADVLAGFEAAKAALDVASEFPLSYPLSRIRFAGFIATSKAMAAHLAGLPSLSPLLQKLLTYGPRRSAADWAEDQQILAETKAALRAIVDQHGAILLPTTPQTAFSHSDAAPANQADLTCAANIAGLPAISIPAGRAANGLPIGVQIIGQAGHEAGLFALARRLDQAIMGYTPPDPF